MFTVTWFLILLAFSSVACAEEDSWITITPPDSSFALSYPGDLLVATRDENGISLTHSVPAPKRPVFCDFKDAPESTSVVVDFSCKFTLLNAGPAWLEETKADASGWVEECELGGLQGFEVRVGTHRCGPRTFTLQLHDGAVLRVSGPQHSELLGSSIRDELLRLPGVLSPAESDDLLSRIVATVKDLD